MTTESLTQAPLYAILTTGPFAVPHAYSDATDLQIQVVDEGEWISLDPVEWSISPANDDAGGDLTLSASAFAEHQGKVLVITRATRIEQGWIGTSAREKGLERQLDREARGIQDLQALTDRMPRLPRDSNVIAPILSPPVAGLIPVGRADGMGWENGPSEDDIRNAVAIANAAMAAVAQINGQAQAAFATRDAFIAAVPELAVFGDGAVVQAAGMTYVRDSTAVYPALAIIADAPGWRPFGGVVCPQHFGGYTGAAVSAAWAYYQAFMGTGMAAQLPSAGAHVFRLPAGHYNSGGSLVTLTTAGFGQVIIGDGWTTRLNNINFVVADGGVNISNLAIEGLAKAADGITWTPRAASIRRGVLENVRIQNARYGLRTIGDANVAWIRMDRVYCEACVKGARFDRVIGISLADCQFSQNDEQGMALYRGGELRMIGCRFNGNGAAGLRLDGAERPEIVVEDYIVACSFSGNYANPANKRTWAITAAADNGAGGTRLTLNVAGGRHLLSTGLIRIDVIGTTSYDGSWVMNAVTDTTVDIAVPFAGSQTGTIRDYGFDFEVVGNAALRPGQVNDLFVLGCNINNSYFKDCVNIRLDACRLKQRVFLDDGVYGLARIGVGRGRLNSTLDDDTDEGALSGSWTPVPITGQNYGFVEDLSVFGGGWTDFRGLVRRVPDPAVPLVGNMPTYKAVSSIDEIDGIKLTGVSRLTGPVLQASSTDTTAGKIWVNTGNGVFGIGTTVSPTTLADIDVTTLASGFYRSIPTSTGTYPPGVAAAVCTHQILRYGSTEYDQILMHRTGGTWRRRYNSGFGSWEPIYVAPLTSIAAAPAFVGQEALVSGIRYRANGTASAADWKWVSGWMTSVAAAPPAAGVMAIVGSTVYVSTAAAVAGDWKALN